MKFDARYAQRAAAALCAVSDNVDGYEPLEVAGTQTLLVDLLADLRHLHAEGSIDLDRALEISAVHFEAEAR